MGMDKALKLTAVRRQIDSGLSRFLHTKGPERAALTMELLRLRWAEEQLQESLSDGDAESSAARAIGVAATFR